MALRLASLAQGKRRLVLIDGNAILHRAYHALPPLTNRSGELVNAVYGFLRMLFKVVENLKPVYLAVAFDTPHPTFRHQEFVGYQAQRPVMEAELSSQIDKVRGVLREMGVAIFEKPGFEADDILGTLAKRATDYRRFKKPITTDKTGMEVVIVSGDRDLMQLVDKQVKMYLPTKGISEAVMVDEEGVEERIGVRPAQIPDYKGLVGDPSDNYPGVAGIGPKTAVRLLAEFGSLEKVMGMVKEERLVDKLTKGKETAVLSKKLAIIRSDVPLNFNLERCQAPEVGSEKVMAVLRSLGFKSLIGKTEEKAEKVKKVRKREEEQLRLLD